MLVEFDRVDLAKFLAQCSDCICVVCTRFDKDVEAVVASITADDLSFYGIGRGKGPARRLPSPISKSRGYRISDVFDRIAKRRGHRRLDRISKRARHGCSLLVQRECCWPR